MLFGKTEKGRYVIITIFFFDKVIYSSDIGKQCNKLFGFQKSI